MVVDVGFGPYIFSYTLLRRSRFILFVLPFSPISFPDYFHTFAYSHSTFRMGPAFHLPISFTLDTALFPGPFLFSSLRTTAFRGSPVFLSSVSVSSVHILHRFLRHPFAYGFIRQFLDTRHYHSFRFGSFVPFTLFAFSFFSRHSLPPFLSPATTGSPELSFRIFWFAWLRARRHFRLSLSFTHFLSGFHFTHQPAFLDLGLRMGCGLRCSGYHIVPLLDAGSLSYLLVFFGLPWCWTNLRRVLRQTIVHGIAWTSGLDCAPHQLFWFMVLHRFLHNIHLWFFNNGFFYVLFCSSFWTLDCHRSPPRTLYTTAAIFTAFLWTFLSARTPLLFAGFWFRTGSVHWVYTWTASFWDHGSYQTTLSLITFTARSRFYIVFFTLFSQGPGRPYNTGSLQF